MKHGKKILSAVALTLCTAMLSACAGISEKVTFKEYWLEDANVTPETVLETLEYEVSFEKASGLSDTYTLDYQNGVYTTKLSLKDDVYRYETTLAIDAIFTVGTETVTKQDSMITWVEFKKNAKLQPIASHKEFISHSPTNGGATIDTCFMKYDYVVDTTYNENGLEGKSVVVDRAKNDMQEKTFAVEDKYTCLDNEQLLLSLRGLSQSTSSATLSVYAPFSGIVQPIEVSFGALEEGTEFTFLETPKTISYYPVHIKINAQLSGEVQTVWIAQTTNAQSNTFRNVILQISTPLFYNLGSLTYKLKSANFI